MHKINKLYFTLVANRVAYKEKMKMFGILKRGFSRVKSANIPRSIPDYEEVKINFESVLLSTHNKDKAILSNLIIDANYLYIDDLVNIAYKARSNYKFHIVEGLKPLIVASLDIMDFSTVCQVVFAFRRNSSQDLEFLEKVKDVFIRQNAKECPKDALVAGTFLLKDFNRDEKLIKFLGDIYPFQD